MEKIFTIPYIDLPSILFGKKLRLIFKEHYRIDLKIGFTTVKVKNYFSLKSRAPLPLIMIIIIITTTTTTTTPVAQVVECSTGVREARGSNPGPGGTKHLKIIGTYRFLAKHSAYKG